MDADGDTGRPLAPVLKRNIEQLEAREEAQERARPLQEKVADHLTAFSGSMLFVYSHAIWFGIWILLNVGIIGSTEFDPFPFGFLTMIVSLEAIFLSTFVLISQNRSAALADTRADLDLQTNLLSEHELTRVLRLLDAVAEKMGVSLDDTELQSPKEDLDAGEVVQQLEQRHAV